MTKIETTIKMLAKSSLRISQFKDDNEFVWEISEYGENAYRFRLTNTPKSVWTFLWHDDIKRFKDINEVFDFAYEYMREW